MIINDDVNNIKKINIKKCPLCGGEAEIVSGTYYDDSDSDYVIFASEFYIACKDCGLKTRTYRTEIHINKTTGAIYLISDGAKEAITNWNSRFNENEHNDLMEQKLQEEQEMFG